MGQYYKPVVNINGEITVYSRDIDGQYTMAKLMEHSWWENDMVNAVAEKFYHTKGQLAWVGDYANDDETPIHMKHIWGIKGEGLSKVDFSLDKKFLVNWDTKEYIDLNAYKKKSKGADGWVIHPLPLLTAIGNGRGGGDYHYRDNTCLDLVGTWAWKTISIEDKAPEGFKKSDVYFIED